MTPCRVDRVIIEGMKNPLKIPAELRKRANPVLDGPYIEISKDDAIALLATVAISACVGGVAGGIVLIWLFLL